MKAHDVDWTTMRLGRRPDREVAEELGCHLDTVRGRLDRHQDRAIGAARHHHQHLGTGRARHDRYRAADGRAVPLG